MNPDVRFLISGTLCVAGAFFLALATSIVCGSIRNIQEFSYCVVGYLGLVAAVGFGIIGLGSFVAGVVLFRFARK